MVLTLRVTSYQQSSLGSDSQKVFDRKGGSIGRNQGNDWILPDAERYLSGKHALIEYRAGNYILTDTSTNGVYIGDGEQPLGKGNSQQLNNGDQLYLGDYELLAIIGEQAADELEITGIKTDISWPAKTEGIPSPAAPEPQSFPVSGSALADEGAFPGDLLTPDKPVWHSEKSEADQEGKPGDALAKEENFVQGGGPPEPPPWKQDEEGDLFAPALDSEEAMPDHIGSDQQFFNPPEAKFEKIPEDWDITGFVNFEEAEPPSGEQAPPPAQEIPFEAEPELPQEQQQKEPAGAAPKETPASEEQTGEQLPAVEIVDAVSRIPDAPKPKPKPKPEPIKRPLAPMSGGDAIGTVQAFLQGAGLDPNTLPPGEAEQFLEQVGKIFRQVVTGLMDVLMARSQLKSEFRLQITMIRPAENNPLKFSVGVNEALEQLLFQKSQGFLPPVEAFGESFRDLKDHELAMMAGVRAVFEQTMSRFEPELLLQQFDEEGVGKGLLALNRKAKYWEQYCKTYNKLSKDAEDHFQDFFGAEFAQAYEEQIHQLAEFRKSKKQ